jgi:hypothetical protein
MSVLQLEVTGQTVFSLDKSLRWWDPDTRCTLVVSHPRTEPDLWREYVRGAQRSYRKHRVERALDMDALRSGKDTSLFFTAVDAAGRVVGGLRTRGPYRSADESHAVVEWAGRRGLSAVRKMIADRLPFGVVEMKTAWVSDEPDRNRALTNTLARAPLHSLVLMDVQFAMATSASHVLDRWLSSGGVVASTIPATPYPDHRYRTQMMWWDKLTFAKHAQPKQVSRYFTEVTALTGDLDTVDEIDAAGCVW